MSKPENVKVLAPAKTPAPHHGEHDLQRLWSAVARKEWSSLVLVPVSAAASTKVLAGKMLEIGELFRPRPKLFDGQGAQLADGPRLAAEMKEYASGGGTAIATVDPVVNSLAGIPLVLAADAAVLVVDLRESGLPDAHSTIEIVGRDRILGCVAVA
ncbi:MAG TPA: hypothetical protein VMT17_18735 [Anaeromyxobacteraceae bacterium]|nr:hypothetical protein [Anaeromyxobacteraceae bacterium]